jgi:hypothetical protein
MSETEVPNPAHLLTTQSIKSELGAVKEFESITWAESR